MSIKDITLNNIKNGKIKSQIPELYELKNVIENNSSHNNQAVFDHTLQVFENLKKIISSSRKLKEYLKNKIDSNTKKDILLFCALFHDIGKKETINKEGRCPDHETVGALKVKKILKRFDFSNKEQSIIVRIIKNHGILYEILKLENRNSKKDFEEFRIKFKDVYIDLCLIEYSDRLNSFLKETKPDEYKFRINFYKKIIEEF